MHTYQVKVKSTSEAVAQASHIVYPFPRKSDIQIAVSQDIGRTMKQK